MEDPYKNSIPVDIASTQGEMCSSGGSGGEGIGKLEDEGNPVIPTEAWNVGSPTLAKRSLSPMLGVPGNPVVTQTADPSGGVALKVATTVLQPICLGESPMVLPILAGAAGPQVAQTGTAPYLVTAQGPVSLPLVLEQQVFQQLTPQVLQQAASCPNLSLPNNLLCQNPSLALAPSPLLDQKGAAPMLDQTLLTLLQNPNFAAILQDLFPSQANPSPTCHSAASPLPDPFSTGFFPPLPLPHPYSSPLAPLVPPPTLLVPYPIVVPLPVPLPIPIPIPIPVPQAEDSKMAADPPKPVCTLSQGTQTSTKDFFLSMPSPTVEAGPSAQPSPSSSCLSVPEGEVLDLSVRAPPPIQTKQETPCQQDSVLDLSVGGIRKTCIQSCSSNGTMEGERDRACHLGENMGAGVGAISLGVLRPVDCSPKLDSKLLSGLASLEFSRQHKWVVDSAGSSSMGGTVHDATLGAGGNIEIVSTSQTAKVIVSVKDAMPAIFCGKLKGLSGVSTKNFSIKRDAGQGGYAALPRVPGDQRGGDPNDPLKKMSKNRSIKLKKVSSQEIHILPIKKQRLAAFLPRK